MGNERLVIGATGKTGKRVADRLTARGVSFRPGSRRSAIPFDWEDAGTWPAALEGIGSAYVAYSPDLAVPSAHGVIASFVEAAERAGLRRVVLLSERREARAQACEELVKASSLEWTILRPSWFAQNFSEGGFYEAVMGGRVEVPTSGAGEPFVDLEDLAEVAVAALLEDGHAGQTYEVTGPEVLTWEQAVATIADVSGRGVVFEACSAEAFEATLVSAGFPSADAGFVAQLVASILDGRNASVGDGVQRVLGREPRSFEAFCRNAHAQGRWDDPVPDGV
ncbi:MAG: NAD(P)H-binding protein [Planctomycetota bacterium]